MLTRSEVKKHSTRRSCWIIIAGTVYDVTDFVDEHPGGPNILLQYAGRDATEAFEPFHQTDTLQTHLSNRQILGALTDEEPQKKPSSTRQTTALSSKKRKVKLPSIISISDFEYAASQILPPRSFAFLKSGAEDELATKWNRTSWKTLRLRPRVLRPITHINTSTTLLGNPFSLPFFICPAGGAKLSHPEGDKCLTKVAAKHGILHWTCSNSSFSVEEMAKARGEGQVAYWQIYAMKDLKSTERQVRRAVELGFKGFALTVDAVWAGKREGDLRANIAEEEEGEFGDEDDENSNFSKGPTVARSPVWPHFDWPSAVTWLRTLTDLPIAIKGIQTWEDAALCMQYSVHPWLSNHGGRQLDGAPSAAETLVSIRQNCPGVFDKCEVIVDGGITRGSDIVKALALGAKGVGLGRAFLYSIAFGEVGASKAIRILEHEVQTTMALLGVTDIGQLNCSYVDASSLAMGYTRSLL
ncbi:oxidoreductase [Aspergillus karnatakaensis]|uniref:FMN-dependent alpha-hydroxy acid dehydrogenase family protein n=1 Tax=Aspergillus karnatakaensis TaxID=1810916 RepID=UPI003CCCF5B2